ncbi:hypothetical protein [Pedobacter sp. NJ-S-72]
MIFAHKRYQVSKEIKSPGDRIEALKKLIELSPPEETKRYFETYQKLTDSLQESRDAAKNQFALIRYEAEKNKSDNLKLQKENMDKKYQIIKQRVLLFSTLLLFLAGSVIVLSGIKRENRDSNWKLRLPFVKIS